MTDRSYFFQIVYSAGSCRSVNAVHIVVHNVPDQLTMEQYKAEKAAAEKAVADQIAAPHAARFGYGYRVYTSTESEYCYNHFDKGMPSHVMGIENPAEEETAAPAPVEETAAPAPAHTYTCPGKCNDCTTPCGLPICYQMQENDRVLFALHGQGVKPASAARAAKRYAANCKKALEELRPGFNPAAVKKIASTANSKVGNAPVINQPAIMTCSNHHANCAGGCGGGTCYALHGQTSFYPSVRARVRNWLLFLRDPERYFNMAAAETRDYRRARWHDSGDIVNARYLQGMIDTARKNPGTVYSTMTKKFKLVNDYICQHGGSRAAALPENLIIMYSEWGNLYDVTPGSELNPYNMPVAGVIK